MLTGNFLHRILLCLLVLLTSVGSISNATAIHIYGHDDAAKQPELQDYAYDDSLNHIQHTLEGFVARGSYRSGSTPFLAFMDCFFVTRGLANPKTIRFSQDSIRGTFRDGRSVQDLVDGLRSGRIKPGDVPPIRVVERNGQLISIDNRRLAAFREAGVPIRTRPATAEEILQAQRQRKFSAGEFGADDIRIRGQ